LRPCLSISFGEGVIDGALGVIVELGDLRGGGLPTPPARGDCDGVTALIFFGVCRGRGRGRRHGSRLGDGGLPLYLTAVIVHSASQRRGAGTAIVAALTAWVDAALFPNTVVGLLPTPSLVGFYQRHGYRPQPSDSPAMLKWVNPQTEV
jgi:GNAT superfamily N-acetyltransferase